MIKPTIGITPCSRVDDYVESVKRAGGEPLLLNPREDPGRALDRIDALLLTGGLDVDPVLYGEPAHPTTEADHERDAFEIPLSRAAVARDLPIFAICRGVQVLNVAAGGTLVQDIPSSVTTDLSHSIDVPKDHLAHAVKVTPGTRLSASLGAAAPLDACPVNSRHHQAVGRVASSFVVSAVSEDGVVEAIERPESTFCLGVQWHPENFWRTGEFAGLFAEFVAAATPEKHGPTADRKDHEDTKTRRP
ncbi:MAG TPA: gamma-glutamyl-gamma-aminobutyrate hydrolase family protein [Vicinamibacterales bacterium]|nr:gamma-glutamyl-gamma-aminobutyrate hydrolase family protein [Vicinamibacterales bacterium]